MSTIAKYNTRQRIPFSPIRPHPDNSLSYASGAGNHSQRPNRPGGIAPNHVNVNSKTSGGPTTSGPTFAPSAVMNCQQNDETERPDTVEKPARRRPKSSDNGNGDGKSEKRPCNGTVPPLNRGYVVPPIVGPCRHCGSELTRTSRNGRIPVYCGTRCRVAAHRQRQRNK